jgi:glycogen synthase
MLSPIAWSTPPKKYGPWESIVSLLTEGLVKRGIDVTLFATADSHTSAKLHAVCPRPYEEDKSILVKVCECLHISEVFERASEFDIIHNNFDYLPLTYSALEAMASGTPVIVMNRGSMPELIRDKETGFLVNGVEETAEAVQKVVSISRKKCRENVEKRFSVDKMVDDYIKVYETILEKCKHESEMQT